MARNEVWKKFANFAKEKLRAEHSYERIHRRLKKYYGQDISIETLRRRVDQLGKYSRTQEMLETAIEVLSFTEYDLEELFAGAPHLVVGDAQLKNRKTLVSTIAREVTEVIRERFTPKKKSRKPKDFLEPTQAKKMHEALYKYILALKPLYFWRYNMRTIPIMPHLEFRGYWQKIVPDVKFQSYSYVKYLWLKIFELSNGDIRRTSIDVELQFVLYYTVSFCVERTSTILLELGRNSLELDADDGVDLADFHTELINTLVTPISDPNLQSESYSNYVDKALIQLQELSEVKNRSGGDIVHRLYVLCRYIQISFIQAFPSFIPIIQSSYWPLLFSDDERDVIVFGIEAMLEIFTVVPDLRAKAEDGFEEIFKIMIQGASWESTFGRLAIMKEQQAKKINTLADQIGSILEVKK